MNRDDRDSTTRRATLLPFFALACVLLGATLPGYAGADATITVVNLDGSGEGFNDPTPAAPVGGNAGTTLGAQRLIAFQHAADLWGVPLNSDVVTRVGATMDPLPCNATSAVLGAAGPNTVHRDFSGAPFANTWYPAALANRLAGFDLAPQTNEIAAFFNSTVGTTCAFPKSWYYGLDGNGGGDIDFVTVVLHELGHGLGFLSFVDDETGQKFLGRDDVFILHLEDHGTGKLYPDMTDAERAAAAVSSTDLHWTGPSVVDNSGGLTGGRHPSGHVEMYAPDPVEPGSSVSHFSTSLTPNEIMEPMYTGAQHDVGLAFWLFADLGWADCGDGVVQSEEECDDGNTNSGDGCTNACTICGNGVLTPPEGCDDGNLVDGDSCTSSCTVPPMLDTILLPPRRLNVTLAESAVLPVVVTKTVKIKVQNTHPDTNSGYVIQLIASDGDCPPGTVGTPDFDSSLGGSQDSAFVLGTRKKTARVAVTVRSDQFVTFNRKAPARCTLSFEARAITMPVAVETAPANNLATMEVNVTDQTDPEQTAVHESVAKSLTPVKVVLGDGAGQAAKTLRVIVGNADYLPAAEVPGHQVVVSASDGDCPAGTVGTPDCDASLLGQQPDTIVRGGAVKACKLPVTLAATDVNTPTSRSLFRCTAVVSAGGAGGDSDATNNTIQVIIDAVDRNDF